MSYRVGTWPRLCSYSCSPMARIPEAVLSMWRPVRREMLRMTWSPLRLQPTSNCWM